MSQEASFIPRSPVAQGLLFMMEPHRGLTLVAALLFGIDALVCSVTRLQPWTIAMVVVLGALRAVLRGFLRPGFLRALDGARRGDETAADELISGTRDFERAIVAHLVADAVVAVSLAIGALPGLGLLALAVRLGHPDVATAGLALAATGSLALYAYAFLGVRLGEYVVAIEELGPFAAVGRAWELARGNRLRIGKIVLVGAGLEMVALVWGALAFGLGLFLAVPHARLASDHMTLELLARLQDEARRRSPHASPNAFVGMPRTLSARGATLPEYALLLVAILLVAGGAFRSLGRSVGRSADRASSALAGSGGSDAEGAAASRGGVAGFLGDFVDGLVKGDFSDRQSAGKVIGQVVGGFIPVYGQLSAVRDAGAAVRDIANGKKDGWQNLGLAAVGFVPGVGEVAKAGLRGAREASALARGAEIVAGEAARNGDVVAAVVGAAKRSASEGKIIGEGSFAIVRRQGDNVTKEIKGEVNAAGGGTVKLDAAERKQLAQQMADLHNQVAELPAVGGVVPKVEVVGDGVLAQKYVDGLTLQDLRNDHPQVWNRAADNAQGKINRAEEGLGLQRGEPRTLPDGSVMRVDDNGANFRFDKEGNVTSWFDPIAVFPCKGGGCK